MVENGLDKKLFTFVHFDNIFLQDTTVENPYSFKIIVPEKLEDISFYKMNSIERLKFIIKYRNRLLSLFKLNSDDRIIVGNDGAVQRLFINKIRKIGGKSYLLLDGNLALNTGLVFYLKKKFFQISDYFNYSYYFPSIRGHTKVNKIYVMHECIKSILLKEGVYHNVEVLAFPRYLKLFKSRQFERKNEDDLKNILYITSAFKWHGDLMNHSKQITDLKDLDFYLNSFDNKNWNVKVRVHPREFLEDYIDLNFSNISFDRSSDYINILNWADVIITTVSTMAYEAIMLGKFVYLYGKNIDVNKTLLCLGEGRIKIIKNLSEIQFENSISINLKKNKDDISKFIEEITV